MNYEELKKINESLTGIDVKGKEYVEVNTRVDAFRQLYPDGGISTEIVYLEGGVCVIKATVTDEDGKILATGTAYEKEGSTFINKTSYIENCETSAIGRALGFVGIGIKTSIASAEEVQTAIANQTIEREASQKVTNAQARTLMELVDETGTDRKTFLDHYGVDDFAKMTKAQYADALALLTKKKERK